MHIVLKDEPAADEGLEYVAVGQLTLVWVVSGRFFLSEFPIFTRLIAPFFPLYEVYARVPFAS